MSKRLYPDMAWFEQDKVLYKKLFVDLYKDFNKSFYLNPKKSEIRSIFDPWKPSQEKP